jgi:hypothetical protein
VKSSAAIRLTFPFPNGLPVSQQPGGRLLSRYDIEAGSFYVITEWDRSMTTVMLREEY